MSTTFIIILLIAIVMAVIGISMNRSRIGRQRHGSTPGATNGSKQQSGENRSRDTSDRKDGK